MPINQYYNSVLIDNFINKLLQNKTSPTTEELRIFQNKIGDLDPTKLDIIFAEFEQISANKINGIIEILRNKFKTIDNIDIALRKKLKNKLIFFLNQLNILQQQSYYTMLSACTIQSGEKLKTNLFYTVNLDNYSDIDISKTSADFDLTNNSIKLRQVNQGFKVDLGHINISNFLIYPISDDIIAITPAPGSNPKAMIDDYNNYWLERVHSLVESPKIVGLYIDLINEYLLSRISLSPYGTDKAGEYLIRVLVSQNGTNWTEVLPKSKQLIDTIFINFSPMLVKYIKIEQTINQPSYQLDDNSNTFIYLAGIKNLSLFRAHYYNNSKYVSKEIKFYNGFGEQKKIYSIMFSPYSEVPKGTGIHYYIVPDEDFTNLIPITPNVRTNIHGINNYEKIAKIRSRFDVNHILLDTRVPINTENIELMGNSIRLFRNIFQKDILIDRTQSGWRYNNKYYSCIFYLDKDIEMDFGKYFVIIDGIKLDGIQLISKGWHSFATYEANWIDIHNIDADPLYPYNHRYLIEGFPNSTVYKGVDFFAAEELELISMFDLINHVSINKQYKYFALYNGYPMIKVPNIFGTKTLESWRYEVFKIMYSTLDADHGLNSIRLVANLATTNKYLSPVLNSYFIVAN